MIKPSLVAVVPRWVGFVRATVNPPLGIPAESSHMPMDAGRDVHHARRLIVFTKEIANDDEITVILRETVDVAKELKVRIH